MSLLLASKRSNNLHSCFFFFLLREERGIRSKLWICHRGRLLSPIDRSIYLFLILLFLLPTRKKRKMSRRNYDFVDVVTDRHTDRRWSWNAIFLLLFFYFYFTLVSSSASTSTRKRIYNCGRRVKSSRNIIWITLSDIFSSHKEEFF